MWNLLRKLWAEDAFLLLLYGSWRRVSLKPVLISVPEFLTLYLPILPLYLSKPSPAFLLSPIQICWPTRNMFLSSLTTSFHGVHPKGIPGRLQEGES